MPRKKPEDLKGDRTAPAPKPATPSATPAPVTTPAPVAMAPAPQIASGYHPADLNGDGKVDAEEKQMDLRSHPL